MSYSMLIRITNVMNKKIQIMPTSLSIFAWPQILDNISIKIFQNYNVISPSHCRYFEKEKKKYRGMFETQKSGNKTSSGEISLNIRTFASPKVGQDQVSGGVSVLCLHAASVENALWKPLTIR